MFLIYLYAWKDIVMFTQFCMFLCIFDNLGFLLAGNTNKLPKAVILWHVALKHTLKGQFSTSQTTCVFGRLKGY